MNWFSKARVEPITSTSPRSTSSTFDLPSSDDVIISRADLKASIAAYSILLESSVEYRKSLSNLSTATTTFAAALQDGSKLKGIDSEGLFAASGLHTMISGTCDILANVLLTSFEAPLRAQFSIHLQQLTDRHAEYESVIAERTAGIRKTELENMREGKEKRRDLRTFRIALESLQEQVNEVEAIKRKYYSETLDSEVQIWSSISSKVSFLLKSTLELADRLGSKASDSVLTTILDEFQDPFDSYRLEDRQESDHHTILSPLSMISIPSPSPSPQRPLSIFSTVPPISPPATSPVAANAIFSPRLLPLSSQSSLEALSITDPSSSPSPSATIHPHLCSKEGEIEEVERVEENEDPMAGDFIEERFENLSPTGEYSSGEDHL